MQTRAEKLKQASWDECVLTFIGPRVGPNAPELQQDAALHLALAALKFAGRTDLADDVAACIAGSSE